MCREAPSPPGVGCVGLGLVSGDVLIQITLRAGKRAVDLRAWITEQVAEQQESSPPNPLQ